MELLSRQAGDDKQMPNVRSIIKFTGYLNHGFHGQRLRKTLWPK